MSAKTSLRKVQEYVERNVVMAGKGRKCVDGRYLPTQGSGMIARPGGDMGYVMALMAVSRRKGLGLSPEKCFNEVYKVVSRRQGRFYLHTDHHADPNQTESDLHHQEHKALIGCGHVAKAALADFSKNYGLEGKDVERVVAYVRNISGKVSNIELINLKGDHGEKGVLVVDSEEYSVNSQDIDSGEMYFIYDKERDMRFLEYLTSEMAVRGVNFEEMKRESDLQINATLHILAKGLPTYNVIFKDKIPSVSFAFFVS